MNTSKRPALRGRIRLAASKTQQEEKLNRHWRGEFLAHLAETSNVSASAAAAGVHPSRPYNVRRNEPEFAALWLAALVEGFDNLEMEVLHRLRFGEPKAEDGRRFDTGGAIRVLLLHRETVTRERAMREHETVDAVRASIDAKLARLRSQVADRAAAMTELADDER